MLNKKEEPFYKIYKRLLLAGFSLIDAAIYAYVEEFQRAGKECFASDSTIAQAIKVERKTVLRARKKMHKEGYLVVIKKGRGHILRVVPVDVILQLNELEMEAFDTL